MKKKCFNLRSFITTGFRLPIILIFIFSSPLFATNYYWVGGTGTWSDYATHWATTSGGTVFHVTIPSPNDDVFFDVNSFPTTGDTVYMDTTITNCHNMDWSGAVNIPLMTGATLKIFGSLTLINAMTCNPSCSFESTDPGNTITTAGHTVSVSFKGAGGEWTLLDTLNTNSFNITAGSFYSNNQLINCSNDFIASGSIPQAVHLGTSVFNVGGSNWQADNSAALVMDAGSATINMNSTGGAIFYGGSYAYHEVNFPYIGFIYGDNIFGKVMVNSTMTIYGSNTFDTLLFNNPGKTITLGSGKTQTIIDTLIADGTCTGLTVLKSYTAAQQATISKANGSITLSYLLMQDINATGGATFTANNSVVISNVTGWTVPTATIQNLYWVGGSGSWNDPNHWATVSGGAGGNCIPSPYDDIYFDANSFTGVNDTVLFNVTTGYCHNMDWTGAANSPLFTNASLKIFGSLTLIRAMTCSSGCSFESTAAGNTITTAGHTVSVSFKGAGGEWTLLDTLNTNSFNITAGSFYSNNQLINCSNDFIASGSIPQAVHLGTSVFNVGGTNWQADNSAALVMDAGSATINMNSTGGAIFYGGSYAYHEVNFPYIGFIYGDNIFGKVMVNSTMTIYGSNTFDTLLFNNPGKTITLGSGKTQTIIDTLIADGTCTGLTVLKSYTAAQQATISKASGSITLSYLLMQDINATGGATFTANNSVVISNVTGWMVPTATIQNLYWVGGSGSWNDPNHWATVSGGAGGNCIPSPYDDIYFDANSFTGVNDTVLFNVTTGYCHNMDWTGAANSPLFTNASLKIFGSLTLIRAMTCSSGCSFESTAAGNTITTAGHTVSVSFKGAGGEWTLLDTLNTNSFNITAGSFYSNNQLINCSNDFISSGSIPQAVHLGTSVFNVGGTNWQADNSAALVMDAGSATINMNSTGGAIFYGGSYAYHEVNFPYIGFIYGDNIFGKVMVNSTMTIYGSNTFDTLLLINPGQLLTLQNTQTNTVNDLLFIQSDPGFPTSIKCATGTTTISQSTGNVCMDYVYLQNIAATGGAGFFAGDHSVDLGGNTGWNWVRCAPLISNVWPGDCNYDLVTDNFDLLNIGVSFGDTGYVRPSASLNYIAQPCQDWYYQFINAANVKHADCDGNGIVDANDSTAIGLNYGLTHPARLAHQDENNSTGTELSFVLPPVIVPGSSVTVPVTLGTSVDPANAVYGIAFTVNYDPAFIQAGTMSVDYSSSWVENAGNHLHLEKDFPGAGKTDIAFTRIDHSDASGFGIIATLNFVASPTANGPFNLSFSHIKVISHNEIEIPIQTGSSTTWVNIDEGGNEISSTVFPNPVTDEAQIIFSNPNHETWYFSMKDVTGRIAIAEKPITSNTALIKKNNLASGVYFYDLRSNEGKSGKGKVVVQ